MFKIPIHNGFDTSITPLLYVIFLNSLLFKKRLNSFPNSFKPKTCIESLLISLSNVAVLPIKSTSVLSIEQETAPFFTAASIPEAIDSCFNILAAGAFISRTKIFKLTPFFTIFNA